MKYIRTKDKKGNQYIISDRDYIFQIRDNKVIFARGYEEELLGQADTIEELCDEFVIIFPDGTWQTYKMFYAIKACLEMDYYNGCKYYGAIWTDKGLIYVAKMNEKGELELL